MKFPVTCAALIIVSLSCTASAAEKSSTREEIKTLVLEDAKKAAKSRPPTAPKSEKDGKAAPAKTEQSIPDPTAAPTPPVAAAGTKAPTELEGKLPQVDVNKSKITQLDHDLHEQDRKMAFEAQNAKATELDGALNSPSINPTILGGYSAKVRTGLAQERLELMEFEKELTEAIARAKTKDEKAALKKQLDDIRTMRRTLDSSPEPKSRGGR